MISFFQKNLNLKILIPAIIIYFLGLVSIVSTTVGISQNHLIYFFLGLVIFIGLQLIDVDFFVKYSIYFYGFICFPIFITPLLNKI